MLSYIKSTLVGVMSPTDPWYFELNTWDDLRDHWQPEFAHVFLPFHPEYLAMLYNCRGSYLPQLDEEICVLKKHDVDFEGFLYYRSQNKKPSRLGKLGLRLDIEDAYNVYMPDHYENALYKHNFSRIIEVSKAISLGYFNPLGIDVLDYPQSSLLPNSFPDDAIDPYFTAITGDADKEWIKNKVHTLLMNFILRKRVFIRNS